MADINLLRPKVKRMAISLLDLAKKQGIAVLITQTLRTTAEQNKLYAQGRTTPGKIVTNVKGGYSFHNHGVAFDICFLKDKKVYYPAISDPLWEKVGVIGEKLGMEWGGRWTIKKDGIVDKPHFQYRAGYTIADFIKNKIDVKKFI